MIMNMQKRSAKQRFKWILLSFIFIFIVLMGVFKVFQDKIIFLPSKLDLDYAYSFETPFEEIFLEAKGNARLNALHFKASDPKGIIVYYHGNAGDLSRWGSIVEDFTKLNWDVLVMDYRTYGKSTGELTEKLLYDDAQLFYDFAKERFSEKDIVVYGRSLGCAMATKVAANTSPQQLILETPFYNLEDMAKRRFPFLPAKMLLEYGFENNTNITEVGCPITILQGTEDSVVPYESAFQLYQLIQGKKSKFVVIEGGEHNDLINFDLYHATIEQLLGPKNIGGEIAVPSVTDN